MKLFAKIDSENNVVNVLVSSNQPSGPGLFVEYFENPGETQEEIAASQAANPRVNSAMIGGVYLPDIDCFMPPKPYPSWLLDKDTYQWVAPIQHPEGGNEYVWDEPTLSWVLA